MKKIKRFQWSKTDVQNAFNAVKSSSLSQRTAAIQYNIPRVTLGKYLREDSVIGVRPGPPPKLPNYIEKKLADYATSRANCSIGFGIRQFMKYVSQLSKKYKIKFKHDTPSEKWWQLFKQRYKTMVLRKPEGTSSVQHQCMSIHKVSKYFLALQQVFNKLGTHIMPTSIWNMDETGLQLDFKPPKIVAARGAKHLQSRTSGKREAITVIAAVNAAGKTIPLHLIPKGKTIKSLQAFNTSDAPVGSKWSVSETGWTKQGIAYLWFTNTFLPNIGTDRPQVLIVDGHDSHNSVELSSVAIDNNKMVHQIIQYLLIYPLHFFSFKAISIFNRFAFSHQHIYST